MDYKEKYEMALEGIQEILGSGEDSIKMSRLQLRLQGIFPELKESEDEKIRKAIHIYLDWLDGRKDYAPRGEYTIRDMIDWVEKQGKHQKFRDSIQVGDKVTRNEDGVLVNLSQLNRVAKPAAKFHKGDWVIHQGTENIYQVVAVIDNQYQLKYGDNYTVQKCADVDRCARLYDVTQDAKNGDVLFIGIDGSTCIFKKLKGNLLYSYIISDGKLLVEDSHYYYETSDNVHPATKEQRDLLFQKMKEAGYEWSSEEKKLKKVEQKPAWSEEDELHIRELESLVKQVWAKAECENDKDKIHKMSDLSFFLKTLKPQLKSEWSEEDEKTIVKMRDFFIRVLGDKPDFTEDKRYEEFIEFIDNRLKSLRPQNMWKPSDEQMNALNYVVNLMASSERPTENDLYYNILKSLRQQLKKLK